MQVVACHHRKKNTLNHYHQKRGKDSSEGKPTTMHGKPLRLTTRSPLQFEDLRCDSREPCIRIILRCLHSAIWIPRMILVYLNLAGHLLLPHQRCTRHSRSTGGADITATSTVNP